MRKTFSFVIAYRQIFLHHRETLFSRVGILLVFADLTSRDRILIYIYIFIYI
jgi:hypothetical protein